MQLIDHPELQFLDIKLREIVVMNLDKNDLAHRQDHILAVVNLATEIATCVNLSPSERRCLLTAAFMHDIACHIDRDTHHLLGQTRVEELLRRYCPIFSLPEIYTIGRAVREHRASYQVPRSGLISDLTRVADAGKLSVDNLCDRPILFRLNKYDGVLSPSNAKRKIVLEASAHLNDKYGTAGYMWKSYPRIGHELFVDEIQEIKEVCDSTKLMDLMSDTYDRILLSKGILC